MSPSPKLAREKVIESHCMEVARIHGIYLQKIHSGAVFVKAGPATYKMKLADQGTPDLMCCVRGRFVGVEVKDSPETVAEWERCWDKYLASGNDDDGRTLKKSWERSVFQHMQHDLIRKAGGEIIVCSSAEEFLEDIKTLLNQYDAKK